MLIAVNTSKAVGLGDLQEHHHIVTLNDCLCKGRYPKAPIKFIAMAMAQPPC